MARSAVITASLIAVALMLPAAFAQTLYKSTMPDGKVIYGDKPAPGAVKVEGSKPATSKSGIAASTPKEAALVRQMEKERKARESEQDRVRKAEIALHDAEVAQTMGRESQPNERQGTATGAQRFTDGYWARQKKLDEAVEKARRNLETVRSGK